MIILFPNHLSNSHTPLFQFNFDYHSIRKQHHALDLFLDIIIVVVTIHQYRSGSGREAELVELHFVALSSSSDTLVLR